MSKLGACRTYLKLLSLTNCIKIQFFLITNHASICIYSSLRILLKEKRVEVSSKLNVKCVQVNIYFAILLFSKDIFLCKDCIINIQLPAITFRMSVLETFFFFVFYLSVTSKRLRTTHISKMASVLV